MKKLYLTLCLIAACIGSLTAGHVDQQKAQRVGTKFLITTTLSQKTTDIQLDLVSVATDLERGGIDYYVFNVRGGEGFVVVSGDDRVKPILAYSTTGQYNPDDVADGFAFKLATFQKEIQYVRQHDLSATTDIMAEWKSVTETGFIQQGRATRAVVGPLCQTTWNQNYPWNSQCPEDPTGNGGHVYAGCVATAMGQVMKYHDWPPQGTGSYTYNPSGYGPQTANFGETDYHFELMPYALDSTSTDEEIFYVAQFLHHCGIAVDMQYSGDGSGAYSQDVPPALRNYFMYSCDEHLTNWWQYNNAQWTNVLKESGLDENLPLYYSGSDDNNQGGHAFVCDGYDENNYFHFNWGWSGRDDAWCPVGALNTTRYAFNTMNGITGHICPLSDYYFMRPDTISDMHIEEKETLNSVTISWVNPTLDLVGEELFSLQSVTIMRDFEEIAVLTDVEIGGAMSYEDTGLAPGLYEYEIHVSNEAGPSHNVCRSVIVGEKCDITFNLHDQGDDGWKGAAISVADANGVRLAVITMTEGSEKTVTLPLLRGQLNFIWNHGWYHSYPQYDTDSECSFTITDFNGNTIYTSANLEDGVFLSYNNDCTDAVDEASENDLVSLYPNPTTGLLNIEGQGAMRISVSNLLGQKLMDASAENNATLDMGQFGQGLYLVRIETANGITVQKVNVK